MEKEYKGFPSAALDQAIESFINEFKDLRISKAVVHRFMAKKCALSFKKAHFHSKERNFCESVEKIYDWGQRWNETGLDLETNCAFLDGSAFHINLKRTMA